MKQDLYAEEVAPQPAVPAVAAHTKSSSYYICSSRNCSRINLLLNLLAAEGDVVESPLVGVAYLAAGPDKPPFVSVGDTVQKGQTLVIIEAMKVMNEIPAPKDGLVTEILVAK